jgi:SpoIID/LytB domain protein
MARSAGRLACRVAIAGALAVVLLGSATAIATTAPAAAEEPISETITVTGRGWGHGRGLGQWGAFGYATGRSGGPWGYRMILDHFFGGTQVGDVTNPLAAVTLLGQRGKVLTVGRAAGVEVGGLPGTSPAVRVTLRADGAYDVQRSSSCTAAAWSPPQTLAGLVRLRAPATTGERADALRLCHDDGTSTGYRGELVAMARTFDGGDVGLAQTVNLVRLDDLLRGVLPLQLPPSWDGVDGGRGRQALLAQAVASRGFAAVGDGRWRDLHSGLGAAFSTCDTSTCQRYGGVEAEDDRTDSVVRETSGEVRVRDGALVRTEYTASTGGWTAGGTFPAVEDVGDAVEANPHRFWEAFLGRAEVEARYGLGQLQAIHILQRSGLGPDGGRVLRLRLVGTTTTVDLTGTQLRTAFGLKSDWFTVSGVPPRPPVPPRDIEQSCPAGEVPPAGFTDVSAANVHLRAIDCTAWWGLMRGTGDGAFAPARRVSREQMASLVARLLLVSGARLPADPPDAFVDDEGSIHEPAIDALAALGVINGTSPGHFQPEAAVGRAQSAALVARGLEEIPVPLVADPPDAFADDAGSPHEPAINKLAAAGIITGASAGRLEPFDPTRRDQMASVLARTLDLVVEEIGIATP